MKTADWVHGIFMAWKAAGFKAVVLRNHEELPDRIRNDVDVLLYPCTSCVADPAWRDVHPNYSFSWESEKDDGMYDAINRSWDRAPADTDWLGHLNADEQYQLGTLALIAREGGETPALGRTDGKLYLGG
jgi:hypothetical protein